MYSQTLLQQTGGAGKDLIWRCGCDHNKIHLVGRSLGGVEGDPCGLFGQVTGEFIVRRNMSLPDSSTGINPLIGSVEQALQVLIF
jgi:hypothetical protein